MSKKINQLMFIIFSVVLFAFTLPLIGQKLNATSDPLLAPSDWAFEASSVALNDAIVQKYPTLDNGDGFVTKEAASKFTGELDLSLQGINGTIYGIENFINLTTLNLSMNHFTGEIPANIDALSKLKFLYLYSNELSGEIPSSIGNLSELELLDLIVNNLSGEIPDSIVQLSNVQYLSLGANHLTGEIPFDIGKLTQLETLVLSNNKLSGEIPTSIGELSKLKYLYLEKNQLSGKIPDTIGNLLNISYLFLHDNQFSETIPSSIGDLNNLKILFLYNNKLTGEIPNSIGQLGKMEYLYLNNNQLTGEVPESIVSLNNLYYLRLDVNQFTSIKEHTYNYITSRYSYIIKDQRYTVNYSIAHPVNQNYTFDALPAYEQFPNYGITYTYTLKLPDGTTKTVVPTISNGKITILGSDLSQAGTYSLQAYGRGGDLDLVYYVTNFLIDDSVSLEELNYISAIADGSSHKVTSTKIIITLSKAIEGLAKEDLVLSDTNIEITNLKPLGNGVYELFITGDWVEGTSVDVSFVISPSARTLANVIITPNVRTTTLHKASQQTTEGQKPSLPITGEATVEFIIAGLAIVISGIVFVKTSRYFKRN
ncbi:leucine-rich repeat domain-containing protein [Culicoidibacter larvae]|uniref:Disease resistance R13L4/SHOC-2-like LRR domain-containing protein n=1 Tax=Culicoidibacter larvae TaxID=2579976 RepID=A0A5R8QE74_9FIRM|nr:hypothetical protein [Culicoidibacter larvae]TLG75488.1 hypothetical protein FEZ08_05440 [Culicoidibacter larvae]